MRGRADEAACSRFDDHDQASFLLAAGSNGWEAADAGIRLSL
ncbi:hypothetical protein B8V81_3717 [Paenibacillus pasadenensis]|uniref:Uncharacterized protein n=1 Tax=Paenibacillus pasadenensis TaxID=217090 RepID=A0A2N5N4K5_9BACL|nr:hypothetical protein B8V81_3717 [Paenibacillus pasadenensis]